MIKLDCLKSLLALTDNENGAVVEMALHILANHVLGDQQMKFAVNLRAWNSMDPKGALFSTDLAESCCRVPH
eukprot:1158325-Pelagomonas_calceolata.AAC.11